MKTAVPFFHVIPLSHMLLKWLRFIICLNMLSPVSLLHQIKHTTNLKKPKSQNKWLLHEHKSTLYHIPFIFPIYWPLLCASQLTEGCVNMHSMSVPFHRLGFRHGFAYESWNCSPCKLCNASHCLSPCHNLLCVQLQGAPSTFPFFCQGLGLLSQVPNGNLEWFSWCFQV